MYLDQPTSRVASEKELKVRGASFLGAYSLPTVNVTLSVLNHLRSTKGTA